MNMKVDLNNLLKQAQDMQSKMQSAQEELAKIVVTGEAGGGLVKIDMDGRHTAKSIWLDPSLLKEAKEFIEELLIGAFNNALQKVEKASRQKLTDLTAQIQTKFTDSAIETE
ncbi:YbaB/EbfC family nucleoid-associated protein [Rickettsiella endosymbiont of Dermanyssus gallinae]|uniref:YbaB/EbfC family nucleoid-associated protein n=1 Tax=Rickettsiella endosymbiont of Dermanyssus gallinae TaxID=2856608 RepID=UPI001FE9F80C|nr:YbaB/EbfC family nucleoid-associated protein [Rickettsiella endosymbiont of Dermanyssus gallinae]